MPRTRSRKPLVMLVLILVGLAGATYAWSAMTETPRWLWLLQGLMLVAGVCAAVLLYRAEMRSGQPGGTER